MRATCVLVWAVLVPFATAGARERVVDQKGRQFSAAKLEVEVGDVVRFVNSDDFFHNVFSHSPAKRFDLGWYPRGQSRSVKLDHPGVVEVECAIHPGMKLRIHVAPAKPPRN